MLVHFVNIEHVVGSQMMIHFPKPKTTKKKLNITFYSIFLVWIFSEFRFLVFFFNMFRFKCLSDQWYENQINRPSKNINTQLQLKIYYVTTTILSVCVFFSLSLAAEMWKNSYFSCLNHKNNKRMTLISKTSRNKIRNGSKRWAGMEKKNTNEIERSDWNKSWSDDVR